MYREPNRLTVNHIAINTQHSRPLLTLSVVSRYHDNRQSENIKVENC